MAQPPLPLMDQYIPKIPDPSQSTFREYGFSFLRNQSQYHNSHISPYIQQLNRKSQQEYERLETERINNYNRSQQMINQAYADLKESTRRFKRKEGEKRFIDSWNGIGEMFKKKEFSLKNAVYQAESFHRPDYMSYEDYNSHILEAASIIRRALVQEGYDEQNQSALKMMLHRFVTGIIEYENENGTYARTHPIKYDFDDPFGYESLEKHFVLKLIKTKSGQCHSMPLYYLILAEELGVEAWLSISPHHSFIKLQDDKGKWYNLELTNGHYTNDNFMMSSGFLTTESVRNGLFLDTLSKEETIIQCLSDLVGYYVHDFGYESNVKPYLDNLIELNPNNINTWLMLSNFMTIHFDNQARRYNIQSESEIKDNETLNALYTWRNQVYQTLDNLGYHPIALDAYKDWLNSFNDSNKEKNIKP